MRIFDGSTIVRKALADKLRRKLAVPPPMPIVRAALHGQAKYRVISTVEDLGNTL
jgi:hypothetical protein